MKQEITNDQWDELTQKQKTIFCDFIQETLERVQVYNPNIGHMIAFLGNDWLEGYVLSFKGIVVIPDCLDPDYLCDFLWEKVKQKLSKSV